MVPELVGARAKRVGRGQNSHEFGNEREWFEALSTAGGIEAARKERSRGCFARRVLVTGK